MSGATDPRDVLRRALIEIRGLKEKLAAAERAAPARAEPVAVVGIGCRFAGGVDSPAAFWRLLSEGRDAVGPRPAGRWATDGAAPREGGFLADVEGFDTRFFGIAPREAAAMDPQHRLLLEVAWEALEHAAIDPGSLAGSRTGVFVGLATNDFARRVPEAAVDRYFGVGSSPAVASGRLAYLLDLRGPCLTLDTACSSSLVAVHYAMRALRDGDCDTALAGGVSLMLGPSLGESFVSAGMLAPDGRCKSFDSRADGYGRGEGAGVVVLRRLSDALRDGDPVLAVLRGSAINQDGRSAGLTAPNGPAQTVLIRAALEAAGVVAADIDYVEAHGTGTPLGDPIEWHALAAAFAGRDRRLLLGSVKSNLGHTEAAAGIAGLIKAVLAVGHGVVPPSLHFTRRNPAISAGATPLEVVVSAHQGVRLAGVSAFGFSGTNAHVVLEAPPVRDAVAASGDVLLLSAQDPDALRALAARYAEAFAAGLSFAAACHTAATGRSRLPWWIAVRSPAELASAVASDAPPSVLRPTTGPRVALPTYPFQRERFPLPGGGPQERLLTPDDPLLAGTDGLAHLGVLLALLDVPEATLAEVAFPAPLVVAAPRLVRTHREDGRIALQSRSQAQADWTTHLLATAVARGEGMQAGPNHLIPRTPAPVVASVKAVAPAAIPSAATITAAPFIASAPATACAETLTTTPVIACSGIVPTSVVPTSVVPTAIACAGIVPTSVVPTGVVPTSVVPTSTVPTSIVIPGLVPGIPAGTVDQGSARALYACIAAAGFHYGPEARCLTHVAVDGDRVSGTVDAPAVTPGAIEAAAQLAYALLPSGSAAVMLAGAERLTRAAGGVPTHAWFHRTGTTPEGGMRADLGLCDAAGHVLLHLGGASLAPLPDQSRRWSRVVVWQPVSLPPPTPNLVPLAWHAPTGDAATVCAALLAVLPQVGERALRIVTHGAQVVGDEAHQPNLGHAALWGMAQAILAERPTLRCRLIDLDPDVPFVMQQAALAAELGAEDEPAIAWRAGRRLARRLEAPARPLPAAEQAVLPGPGVLRWQLQSTEAPGPGMVRISVVAAGLTFRDRLLFNGLLPADTPLGSDCAGVVEATGPGVTGIHVGDRVVALARGAIADSVIVPAEAVAPAPCSDLVAAATMPIPYLTALAGLAGIGPDDCVLVHQAGSATGLAALEVARRAGARVVATAARHRHAWFDAGLPIRDSRDPASWGNALAGVTVAFGAFDPATEALLAGLRVVNLDKRAAGHFDLDRVEPRVKRSLLNQLADLPPLPRRIMPRGELGVALGAEGPLVGRSVVLLREPPPASITPGVYMVTGAAGALGSMVAAWLATAGATLCLVDRLPVAAELPHIAVQADAGDAAAMAALLDRIAAGPSPLRGVFHCAALVDDDRLEQQTADRLGAVLRAKVDGALVLDRLTRPLRLEHFVLFASVVGLLPSARQAGYAAANAVLDQIARGRRQRGLPGLSLDWGPWHAGIGRQMGVRAAEAWSAHGVTPILPAAGLRALPALLAVPEAQRVVADIAWDRQAASPEAAERPDVRPDPGPVTVARLQAVLAPLLGVRDPSTLDPETPLLSFGLDSLTAVEFARALSRELGRPVAPDFVYNHPTLAQAAPALAARRPVPPRAAGFLLLVPQWQPAAAPLGASGGWTVAGDGPLAVAMRSVVPADPANLLDLSALDVATGADRAARDALFPSLLERLRARIGMPARIVLAMPETGALAGALDGLAAALAAEHPGWVLRTLRLDQEQTEVAALRRELAVDDAEPRVRLMRNGRQVLRLVPITPRTSWQPAAEATYLVTGGSGGIGALVAAHLVARGARHLVLAARRPTLPPALAGSVARVRLHAVDFTDPDAVAALMAEVRASQPPLRGIFHTAGVTADGTLAATGWDRWIRAFPAKADGARLLDSLSRDMDLEAFVLFASTTAWFGLPGTSGYAAANGFLDGLAEERRAAGLPAVSIAWGAWQGVGMAADPALWQDGRVPSLPADGALAALDAALGSGETALIATDPAWRPAAACRLLELDALAAAGGRA